jgi:hypothetical protein
MAIERNGNCDQPAIPPPPAIVGSMLCVSQNVNRRTVAFLGVTGGGNVLDRVAAVASDLRTKELQPAADRRALCIEHSALARRLCCPTLKPGFHGRNHLMRSEFKAIALAILLMLGVEVSAASAAHAHAPVTPVEPAADQYYGVTVTDPYRWLEKNSYLTLTRLSGPIGDSQ